MPFVSFDWKLMNQTALKAAVAGIFDAIEPALGTPGNLDKQALDALKKLAADNIDLLFAKKPLVVGAAAPAVVDATSYLSGFVSVPAASAAFVNAHPEVVGKLTAKRHNGRAWFSHAEQQAMLEGVGSVDWLSLLMTIAPIILKALLALFL